MCLALALGGCSSNARGTMPAANRGAHPTAPSSTTTSTPSPTPSTTSPGGPQPTAATTAPPGTSPQNLTVTGADLAALTATYVAFMHFPSSDIGIQAASVHYSYLPSSRSYWAMARFEPSATASLQTQVNLQDNASIGFFSHLGGASWGVVRTGSAPFCPSAWGIPAPLLSLWGLTDSPVCVS